MNLKQKIFLGLFCAATLVNPLTIKCATAPNLQDKLSQEEAEAILREEKNNLEITIPVEYQWGTCEGYGAALGRHPDKEAAIIFADPKKIDRVTIRHELYHLYQQGDISNLAKVGKNPAETKATLDLYFENFILTFSWRFFLYEEPAADLYSITGIRL